MVKVTYRNFVLAGSCVSWISTLVDLDSRSLRFVHFNILKNSFFHLVAPVIPSCHRLESGCKGKDFFITSKLFKRNFWSFFSNPDQGNILKNSAQPKTLETNPSPPLTCAIGLTPHSLIAAAKIEQFIPHLQIFYQLFFKKNEYFT